MESLVVVVLLLACTSCQAQSTTEDDNGGVGIPWFIWVVIVVVAIIASLLILCTAYFCIYNIKVLSRSTQPPLSMTELDEIEADDHPLHSMEWELDRKRITLRKQLGIGEFGPIYDAELQLEPNMMSRTLVNVFQQGTSQDLVRFREEIEEIRHLQHPHVGRVFGVVSQSPYYMVMELTVNGDLKTFLLTASQKAAEEGLSPGQLVALATDVADGLSYMERKGYIHKDVAARNCIVMQTLSAKITDFRLGRFLHRSEYAVQNDGSLMPVRWMSPESISRNKFTLKSSVWSFGVLLWEVMGRGEFPYQELGDGDVASAVCHSRLTLSQPAECPDTLYREMLHCWSHEAKDRPKMTDLHQMLKSSILTNKYT